MGFFALLIERHGHGARRVLNGPRGVDFHNGPPSDSERVSVEGKVDFQSWALNFLLNFNFSTRLIH